MTFLKKKKAPGKLPDLAIDSSNPVETVKDIVPTHVEPVPISQEPVEKVIEAPVEETREVEAVISHAPVEAPSSGDVQKIKTTISQKMSEAQNRIDSRGSFFSEVLDDINGEIEDINKLEGWYKDKFLKQDVVSDMKDYWEDNKSDFIIKTFGSDYKLRINEKIANLQKLESEWREVYFRLIQKEEEMKKEEHELKDTVSEFVDLCKRRGDKKK